MKPMVLAAVLAVAALPVPAAAQPQAPAGYAPGLGEIMTLTQMRHLKLWFAGDAKNWELADYELDELKEGFDDAIKYFPTKDNMPIGQLVKDTALPAAEGLKSAIDARNGTKFAAAFDKLTAACNACHQATDHGFIVVRRPTANPYANQSVGVKK